MDTRKRSTGLVNVDFAKTTKSGAACICEMLPPLTTSFGAPPETGIWYRFTSPFSFVEKNIERPSGENMKSSTERSGVSKRVRFVPVDWSYKSRYQRSDSNPAWRWDRMARSLPSGE